MKRFLDACARRANTARAAGHPHGHSVFHGALLAVLVLVLPGCAGPAPTVHEVKVPVYTPCVTAVPARPAFESLTLPGDASSGEKVLALARDTVLHFKYEGLLEAALAGCLELP